MSNKSVGYGSDNSGEKSVKNYIIQKPIKENINSAAAGKEFGWAKTQAQNLAHKIAKNKVAEYGVSHQYIYKESEYGKIVNEIKAEVQKRLRNDYVCERGITEKNLDNILNSITIKMVEYFVKQLRKKQSDIKVISIEEEKQQEEEER